MSAVTNVTEQKIKVHVECADPTALGVFGLSMVTLVASSQKLGWTDGASVLIAWAIILGSFAQIIGSIYDFKRNNLFGATVLGAFGLFWSAVGICWLMQIGAFGPELAGKFDGRQLGFAFMGYLAFSIIGTIASLETNKVFMVIMVLIDVLLLCLSLAAFKIGGPEAQPTIQLIAGLSELIVAILGFYATAAYFLNGMFGRKFVNLGAPLGIFKK